MTEDQPGPTRDVPTSLPLIQSLAGKSIFLSASFPLPDRDRQFYETADPDEISQAILAIARATFVVGGRLVFGGHPTISPLVMLVAEEYTERGATDAGSPFIVVYQSEAFESAITPATRLLIDEGLAEVIWTPIDDMEREVLSLGPPDPQRVPNSLAIMRSLMLQRADIAAAIFVGGMEGIRAESEMLRDLNPRAPQFFIGAPGGAARRLAGEMFAPRSIGSTDVAWLQDLQSSREYPSLMQRLIASLQ